MHNESALGAVLAWAPRLHFANHLYRVVDAAWQHVPLSGEGARRHGGRFTPAGSFQTLYVADSAATAQFESGALFHTDQRLRSFPKAPFTVMSIDAQLSGLIDLRDPDLQAALGTDGTELLAPWIPYSVDGKIAPTQILGRAAHNIGDCSGLVFQSHKNTLEAPNAFNVAIFLERMTPQERLHVVGTAMAFQGTHPVRTQ